LPKIDDEFTPEEIKRLMADLNDTTMEFAKRMDVRSLNTIFEWRRGTSEPRPQFKDKMRYWRRKLDKELAEGEQLTND
jgi:DNA-binding transcriptional regulator YiaG